jgi:hypothetical protein
MSDIDRTRCREAARECIKLASLTQDPNIKATLLTRAQEWIKLAYSDSDEKFRELVSEFNSERLITPGVASPVQRQPMQQQQQQQQQQQKKNDRDG